MARVMDVWISPAGTRVRVCCTAMTVEVGV